MADADKSFVAVWITTALVGTTIDEVTLTLWIIPITVVVIDPVNIPA